MKRRLLIIAICLLLGAVVNAGVAWGFAAKGVPWELLWYEGDDMPSDDQATDSQLDHVWKRG